MLWCCARTTSKWHLQYIWPSHQALDRKQGSLSAHLLPSRFWGTPLCSRQRGWLVLCNSWSYTSRSSSQADLVISYFWRNDWWGHPWSVGCRCTNSLYMWYPGPGGWWYPGPRLNRINSVLIPTGCVFFFESLSRKNLQVKCAWLGASWDEWPIEKFSRVRMSEDKVRTKDPCWSVGTIYNPRELSGVSTAGLGLDGVLQVVSELTLAVSWACVG